MDEKPKKPKQLTLGLDQQKPPAVKKQTTQRKVGNKTVSRKAKAVRPHQANASEHQARTKSIRSAEQPSPHLIQSHTKRAEAGRMKVQPPPIGKRKGYRAPLSSYIVIPLVIASVIVLVVSIAWVSSQMQTQFIQEEDSRTVIAVTIERGMTARSVSMLLEQVGVIEDAQALLSYFVEHNLATVLRTGSYLMENSMSFEQIGTLLTTAPVEVSLTISPAFTLRSIDRYLVNRLGLREGAFVKASEDLAIAYGLSFAEGWLLSGTYEVNRMRAAEDLVLQMYKAMLAEIKEHLASEQLKYYSVEELLIVASMIQAETQAQDQMAGISSVIHNRLKNGEPLGIDATTRYELEDWVNPIPREALETKSDYNTRRKAGLPPSGICSPGKEAVKAAFFPAETPYFYYLHGLDRQIHFAKTYDEHKVNITLYR